MTGAPASVKPTAGAAAGHGNHAASAEAGGTTEGHPGTSTTAAPAGQPRGSASTGQGENQGGTSNAAPVQQQQQQQRKGKSFAEAARGPTATARRPKAMQSTMTLEHSLGQLAICAGHAQHPMAAYRVHDPMYARGASGGALLAEAAEVFEAVTTWARSSVDLPKRTWYPITRVYHLDKGNSLVHSPAGMW